MENLHTKVQSECVSDVEMPEESKQENEIVKAPSSGDKNEESVNDSNSVPAKDVKSESKTQPTTVKAAKSEEVVKEKSEIKESQGC